MTPPATATAPGHLFETTVFRAALRMLEPHGITGYVAAGVAQKMTDQLLAAGLYMNEEGELQMPARDRKRI